MRIIFLDIDGVLNSARSALASKGYGTVTESLDRYAIREAANLDPIAVKL